MISQWWGFFGLIQQIWLQSCYSTILHNPCIPWWHHIFMCSYHLMAFLVLLIREHGRDFQAYVQYTDTTPCIKDTDTIYYVNIVDTTFILLSSLPCGNPPYIVHGHICLNINQSVCAIKVLKPSNLAVTGLHDRMGQMYLCINGRGYFSHENHTAMLVKNVHCRKAQSTKQSASLIHSQTIISFAHITIWGHQLEFPQIF